MLSTSKTTVGKVVDIGEKVGLWRKDPETVASDDGYEIKRMRLELQPAFDAPPKQADLDRPKHGGARPGAGRKPKCTGCPPGTVHRMVTKRTVSYHCAVHGLIKEETLPDVIDAYIPDGIQDETGEENVGTSVSSSAPLVEADTEFQDEMVEQQLLTSAPSSPSVEGENQDETGSGEDQGTLIPLADKKHSGQPEAPIIGPTRIGDAIVNLSYIENRLKAGDISAIERHCQLAGADYGAVIAALEPPRVLGGAL